MAVAFKEEGVVIMHGFMGVRIILGTGYSKLIIDFYLISWAKPGGLADLK